MRTGKKFFISSSQEEKGLLFRDAVAKEVRGQSGLFCEGEDLFRQKRERNASLSEK